LPKLGLKRRLRLSIDLVKFTVQITITFLEHKQNSQDFVQILLSLNLSLVVKFQKKEKIMHKTDQPNTDPLITFVERQTK
jgi:formylmethanofuran dehydrogenase subunit A